MRLLARGGGLVLAGAAAAAVFGWVRTKALASALGPDGLGVYGQLVVFATYAGSIASLGVGVGTTKLIAANRERGRHDELSRIFAVSVALPVVAGVLFAALGIVLALPIAHLLIGSGNFVLILLASLSIPFVAAQVPLQHALQGFRDAAGQTRAYIVYGAFFATASAVGAFAAGTTGAVVALLLGNIALAALYLTSGSRQLARAGGGLRLVRRTDLLRAPMRALLTIGAAALVLLVLGYISDISVRTVLLHERKTEAGLWYGLSLISVQFVTTLSSALSYFTAPLVTRAVERREATSVRGVLDDSLRLALLGVLPVLGSLIALRAQVVEILFTGDFRSMTPELPLQLVGDAFRTLDWVLGAALIPLGLTTAWFALGATTTVVFGVTGLLLAQRLGVHGAVIAWTVEWALELTGVVVYLAVRRIWVPRGTIVAGTAISFVSLIAAWLFPGAGGLAAVAVATAAAGFVLTTPRERGVAALRTMELLRSWSR